MTKIEDFVGDVVLCRWIDITSFPRIEDLDVFTEQDDINQHSLVFISIGKVEKVDKEVVLFAMTFSEKSAHTPKRVAHDPMNIPRGCILEMRELEYKEGGKVYVKKTKNNNDSHDGPYQDLEGGFPEDWSRSPDS